jgi:DNA mismatch repair protein MutS2
LDLARRRAPFWSRRARDFRGWRRTRAIADLRELARELSGKILPDGTLADHASVALARLRRDIERQRAAIQHSLERFLRAHHEDGTLQEDFVTIRNDRFVVPVVTGRERRVDGVIHGASGSGHTLFVEPLETIELNNELVRLTEEELREVHRILRDFTARLREHAAAIAGTAQALARLEFIFAKAEFAVEFRCSVPRITPDSNRPDSNRRLVLRGARHPLLEDILRRQQKAVIPVSFDLDEPQRTLLMRPNTGGKTVTQEPVAGADGARGFAVPASRGIPLFDECWPMGDTSRSGEPQHLFGAHCGDPGR